MKIIEQIWHSICHEKDGLHSASEHGDTLIEVAIAMAVLGSVALLTFTTMNSSLVSIMNSTQRTSVQQKVNSQIEMINYIRNNDPAQWKVFTDSAFGANYGQLNNDSYKCQMSSYNSNGALMPSTYESSTDARSLGSVWLEYHPEDSTHPVRVYSLATAMGTDSSNRSTAAKYWGSVQNRDYAFDGRSGVSTVSITDPQPGYGIWVDVGAAQPGASGASYGIRADEPYIDVVVKACWTPFGAKSDGEARILQTYRMHRNELSEDY